MTSAPPGPRYPRALQTLGWVAPHRPLPERCRQRYGDIFTLRIAHEGTVGHPAPTPSTSPGVHGDRGCCPRRRGQRDPAADRSARTRCCCSTRPPHMRAAQAAAAAVPRRAHAALRRADARGRRARDRDAGRAASRSQLWPRMQAITLEVIMRAVFGVREGDAARAPARRACATMLDWTADRRRDARSSRCSGPTRIERVRALPARARAGRRAALRGDPRPPRRADLAERDDILSLLLQARHEDGSR